MLSFWFVQANEDELSARNNQLEATVAPGNDLIKAGNFGADKIQERIKEINGQWGSLMELTAYRKKRLLEAVDFYQVCKIFTACYYHQSSVCNVDI